MIMKLSTYSMHGPEQFNGFQQIIAHLGGMAQAFLKHYPINWTFHWRGICRAILSESLIASKRVKRNRTQA
jgi:hypothetical protein